MYAIDGGMDGVDACFGIHGLSVLETGNVNIVLGYWLSGCDTIYVKFEGEYQNMVQLHIL